MLMPIVSEKNPNSKMDARPIFNMSRIFQPIAPDSKRVKANKTIAKKASNKARAPI
jgi:hypothetical protein